ncbi:uncharacterized protein LOC102803557 [Saccoglossus kowalevskii]|uniref:Myb-like protein X-like n=1 Tax=Saccoglossus kowalevskii TaxID=10224 RepID=A0ABM0LYL0_SACKO|nr:PREDICTED: myb-like protein X-like [Saccoglossus kowalevskii]
MGFNLESDHPDVKKSLKLIKSPGTDFACVFWTIDKQFGVIPRKDCLHHEDSLEDLLFGDAFQAMYGKEKYDAVFVTHGASESELVKLAKKLSSIRIVRISHETPNSGKRQRKNKQRADFVDEEDRSSEEETAESPRKKRKNIKTTSKNKVSTKTSKEKETKESKEAKEKKKRATQAKKQASQDQAKVILGDLIDVRTSDQNRRSPPNQDDRSPPKHSDMTPLNQYDKAHPDQQDSSLSNQHSRFLLSQHNRYSSNQHDSRSPTRQHDRPPPNPCDSRSPTYQQDSLPPNQHNSYPSNQHYSRSPTHLNDSPPPSQYNNYPHNQHDGSFSNQHHRCPTNQLIATNDRSVNQHDKSPPLEEYSRPLSGQHYISYPDQCYNYAPDHQFSSLNEHTNTSPSFLTLLGNSDVCAECLLKDKQLKSMQEKLQKTEMDYHHIKIKYHELKASKALYSSTSISHTPKHYVPVRGVQIPAAPHEFVALGTDPPLGFERLGSTNLCVQSLWLSTVTSKCRNDSPSLFMKKMIDGFFLPEQLSGMNRTKLAENITIDALIKYACSHLKMADRDITTLVNQKCCSMKRAHLNSMRGNNTQETN